MIRELSVSNYRSLGPEVILRPGPRSVLIGPNGAGKSNTMDALAFVRDAVTQGLPAAITHRRGIDSVRRRSHGHPFDVQVGVKVQLGSGRARYSLVITGDRHEEYRVKSETAEVAIDGQSSEFCRSGDEWSGPDGLAPRVDDQSLALTALGGTAQFKPLTDFLSSIAIYAVFPDMLRRPQKFDPSTPMKGHGENWVSILRELIREPRAKDDLVAGLHKLTGDIEDVRVVSAAGYLIAEFKQQARARKGKRWFDASQQSDGTLRVAGLLTALLQTPRLPVICVEEPELTVHPGALPMIYDYLRQASETSQILVTTHSPVMLDVVKPEDDAVFVVERVRGKTDVRTVTQAHLAPVRKSLLRLGDLFTSGELQLSLFGESETG